MKERYINPFTDFGFKRLFGEELNKDLLIDFLNELLKGEQTIKDLSYKKIEYIDGMVIDRKGVLDLFCENDKGEKLIVEIQIVKHKFFKDRGSCYSTFPIAKQAEQGEWNYESQAVYMVAILDFTFDDEDREKTVVSHVQLTDTEKKRIFCKKLTFIYLQLPNFNKTEDELVTKFDKWLYIFKNLQRLHDRPAKLQERVFEKLFSIAEIAKITAGEKMAYEESLKVYRDLKNSFDTAREEGMIEWKIKGKAEVAVKMIDKGETDEKIALYTGLSIEAIKELRG
jgi:predicted transposase/invertase (TIGR01784 family)